MAEKYEGRAKITRVVGTLGLIGAGVFVTLGVHDIRQAQSHYHTANTATNSAISFSNKGDQYQTNDNDVLARNNKDLAIGKYQTAVPAYKASHDGFVDGIAWFDEALVSGTVGAVSLFASSVLQRRRSDEPQVF